MEVHVMPSALEAYRALTAGKQWEVGTSVAAFHRHGDEPGSVFAMTKLAAGGWEYVVVAPDGTVEDRGALPLCARCHADAPADSLFGVPRPSPESAAADLRSQ
jgi:hypothetical protein